MAVNAATARHKKREELKEKERKHFELQAKAVKTILSEFDADKSGKLETSELKRFLHKNVPESLEPDDKAVAQVIKAANKRAKTDGDADAASLSGVAIHHAVTEYRVYLEKGARLQALFAKHDTSGDGSLSRAEVETMMQELYPSMNIDDGDVDFVMEKGDASGDGSIDPEELQSVLTTFGHISKMKKKEEEKKKSSICVVL